MEAFLDGEREGDRAAPPMAHPVAHEEGAGTPSLSCPLFSDAAAVDALRRYFERSCGAFSAEEVARLRFVRWLVRTGRLDP